MKIEAPLKQYKVISQFWGENLGWDYTKAPFFMKGHNGLDFACIIGTPVYACDDGDVYQTNPSEGGILMNHAWGGSMYWHNSELLVKVGDRVTKGQMIAKSGNAGKYTTGAHLHWSIWVNGDKDPAFKDYTNPLGYMLDGQDLQDKYSKKAYRIEGGRKRWWPDRLTSLSHGLLNTSQIEELTAHVDILFSARWDEVLNFIEGKDAGKPTGYMQFKDGRFFEILQKCRDEKIIKI